eukprot:4527007-Pyramimonas_sp.AAC.1
MLENLFRQFIEGCPPPSYCISNVVDEIEHRVYNSRLKIFKRGAGLIFIDGEGMGPIRNNFP